MAVYKNFKVYTKYINVLVILLSNLSFADDNKIPEFLDLTFINKDWVAEQRPYYSCPGYYKQLPIPSVTLPEISANSSELSKNGMSVLNGNVSYLDGKQKISAEQAKIYRDSNKKQFTKLHVKGNVEYLTNDIRVVSNQIDTDLINQTAYINTPAYYHYYSRNARGEAKRAKIIKDKKYIIYEGSFTSCPPDNSDWIIKADKITIDPNKQIATSYNTFLYFYNVPIFYSPYLSFPTASQRESGFLMPLYNSSDRFGYSIATPYYFNLAPNYDMTIAPRYMTKRNTQILAEARYLNNYGMNTTNIEYLPHDKEFENFRKNNLNTIPVGLNIYSPRIKELKHASSQRYAVKIKDIRQWTPYLTTNIDYSHVSDSEYYIDLPRTGVLRQQTKDHLLQQARLNYSYHNWQASTLVKGYQTLHTLYGPDLTEPYRILPSINISNNNILILNQNDSVLPGPVIFSFDSHATRFAAPRYPSPTRLAEGQRYYFKPSLSLPINKSYGFIKPSISINSRYYDLNRLSPTAQMRGDLKNQNYFIPLYSIDSGLYFDKTYTTSNNLSLNHTLEPRVFYLYVPKRNQNQAPDFDLKTNTINYEQLFRDNDFSGFDRQSSANKITTGIVSRLQNAKTGHEYLKLQIAQSYLFENRSVTICDQKANPLCIKTEIPAYKERLSPLVSQLFYNFDPTLYGQAQWQWDYFLEKTRKINLGIHYINQFVADKSPQTLFNLEYNFLKEGNIQKDINGNRIFKANNKRNNLSELETSLKLPIHYNWTVLGFYSYDIRNQTTLDRYLGLELQKCCWAMRIGYRNQLRLRTNSLAPKKYDNIFTIQFSLKGLGELNQGFESILQNNITGYQNHLDQIY